MNRKLLGNKALTIVLATLMAMLAGCASSMPAKQAKNDIEKRLEPNLITEIGTTEEAASTQVTIKGKYLLKYTSVKQVSPLGLLLYFPGTALDDIRTDYTIESDVVSAIRAHEVKEKGHTSRIEISLKKDIDYNVKQVDTTLIISFTKPSDVIPTGNTISSGSKQIAGEKPAVKRDPQPDEKTESAFIRLQAVDAIRVGDSVRINVQADGPIKDYKSFTIGSPPRIVFDLFNVKSLYRREQSISLDSEWVKKVRHVGYPDRVRLKIDTKKAYLAEFSASSCEKGLCIYVGTDGKDTGVEGEIQTPAHERKSTQTTEPKKAPKNAAGSAWINRIEFASEDAGKSTVIIGATAPIDYKIKKAHAKKLLLDLPNTNLPDYRKCPLITTRFKSAVDRITPIQRSDMKDRSMIAIEMRESVPYFVERMDNLLMIHFESSKLPPKPFEAANLPAWKKVLSETAVDTEAAVPIRVPSAQEKAPESYDGAYDLSGTKTYTGEKIALDFFETDIKNVFRILREVSGKNFAIDKNVKGKVTLSLEKPVPWDQVLDLILKMNQLGTIAEGDIVRIATLNTIKKEEDLKRARIAAVEKTRQQVEALEPLVTEYIPINYSQASAIVKHLDEIKTKDRASLSVDGRTNTIIMTDVPAKIEQAKEITKELDKPTAQVVIEARIVEANSDFAREFGVEWSAASQRDSNTLGGLLDLDAAVNLLSGVPSDGTIGFNFSRLTGNQLELNARINASETQGDLKIISAPKIVTLDNQEASIKQGVEFPYKEESESGGTTVQFKQIDLELKVTPHVTNDDRISMNINIMKNDLASLTSEAPAISTKEAKTELLVNDGETVVIGGINKTTKAYNENAVPFLSRIPVLSWLFKSTGRVDNKEELLIFITPRILRLEQV